MDRLAPASVCLLLAACAGLPGSVGSGPAVPTPAYHIGDRWTYRGEDGFLTRSAWVETDEITAASPSGITLQVTQQSDGAKQARTERWAAPGKVTLGRLCNADTREFVQPLQRWNFPLAPGQTWSQWLDNVHGNVRAPVNHYVRVGGWEKVTTPAGSFDAIRLSVYMLLDDEDPTRWQTNCHHVVWYAPAVRGVVREEREARYVDKSTPYGVHRTQHGVVELMSFTPGAS